MQTDFHFSQHGSICLLAPLTESAREWVADNLPADAFEWAGAIVIEPRYLGPIVDGIVGDGLTVAP